MVETVPKAPTVPVPASARPAGWEEALESPFEALAGGDRAALEAIWDAAGPHLYAIALWRTGNEEDARDVVQEVFVRLAAGGQDLSRVRTPHLWLLTVAHRAAVDLTRRRSVRSAEPLDMVRFLSAPERNPESLAEEAELSRALARLPGAQREAVSLRHIAGHSFREIGAITGVPTFTAASRCRLGLARLRRLLEGNQ
ncbi:MAG: RNA polymerase sigma factor [Thermoanaerobaculia bacterium]